MTDLAGAQKMLESYRFFPLESGKQQGDRFLEPWILLLTMAKAGLTKRSLKRLKKQLDQFFDRAPVRQALDAAGSDRERLLEAQLLDSARRYLDITKSDPGYNSSLFGLIKLKEEDRERKLAGDVQTHMLGTLLELDESAYRGPMLRGLHKAFGESLDNADEWFGQWQASLSAAKLAALQSVLGVSPGSAGPER